jgi:hypothetical protein
MKIDTTKHADYDFVALGNNQVLVTSGMIYRFSVKWPCSGMTDLNAGAIFTFTANGDLVDIEWFSADSGATIAEPEGIDQSALLALSQDAQTWMKANPS